MKYEFVRDDTIKVGKHTLIRIRYPEGIIHKETGEYIVPAGTLGGYIERVSNLSQDGYCWVDRTSMVFGRASVSGCSGVVNHSVVCQDAKISGLSIIQESKIYGHAIIDNGTVCFGAVVSHHASVRNFGVVFGTPGYKTEIGGRAVITNKAMVDGLSLSGDCRISGEVSATNATGKELIKKHFCITNTDDQRIYLDIVGDKNGQD